MRAAVLLDIDGVLNPLSVDCPPGFEAMRLGGYDVQLNPRLHAPMLRQLAAIGDLIWATSWEQDANTIIAPRYRMPSNLEVIAITGADATAATWKLPDVAAWADRHPGRPVVWLDDELGDDAHSWARTRTTPTLLVPVAGQHGLTSQHVQQVQDWANRLPA